MLQVNSGITTFVKDYSVIKFLVSLKINLMWVLDEGEHNLNEKNNENERAQLNTDLLFEIV